LIIHFWALEAERGSSSTKPAEESSDPDPKQYLQSAFEQTKDAVEDWLGTTTASGALIHSSSSADAKPVLYVTQLGDSQILVIRPPNEEIIFKTQEQYHWFACPRQLGTNSPDTPAEHAVLSKVEIEENDIVLAVTDGVSDNLWEHEVVDSVLQSLRDAQKLYSGQDDIFAKQMKHVATELVKAAMLVAQDPDAQCPYMERALDEGRLIIRV
jgi:serine/threonine protein phosphatase PrpC